MSFEDKVAGRVEDWFKGNKKGPLKLELRPTNQCNLDCISCKARGERWYSPDEELRKEEILQLLEEGSKMGVEAVHISGSTGEPLFAFDKTIAAMEKIKDLGMRGEIVTNGTLFKGDSAKRVVEIRWDKITFSVDAPDAKTHDFLRGKDGAFSSTVNTIKEVQRWKEKLGVDRPEIQIAIVVSSENYDKLKEMLTFSKKLNADNLLLQTLTVKDREIGGELIMSEEEKGELKENLEKIEKLSKKIGLPTNIDVIDDHLLEEEENIENVVEEDAKNEKGKRSIPCFLPWYFLEINSTGITEPCGTRPLGGKLNVKDRNLEEIWFSEDFESFRKRLKSGDIPEACTKCCGATIMTNRKVRKRISE